MPARVITSGSKIDAEFQELLKLKNYEHLSLEELSSLIYYKLTHESHKGSSFTCGQEDYYFREVRETFPHRTDEDDDKITDLTEDEIKDYYLGYHWAKCVFNCNKEKPLWDLLQQIYI
jgi:hypothetical protein